MKKAAIQIVVLAGILLAIFVGCRLTMGDTYVAYSPIPAPRDGMAKAMRVSVNSPEILTHDAPKRQDGYIQLTIQPQRRGETFVDVYEDDSEDALAIFHFHIGRFRTVYDDSTGGFTGDSIALSAFTVFCLLVAAIMFRVYRQSQGPAFYSYATIYAAGFTLFSLLTGLTMLTVTVRHLLWPMKYNMLSAYSTISGASSNFMLVTAPFLLAFAVAMAISNVALLRHERFRPQNVLGIGVSVLLVAGEALGLCLMGRNFAGSEWAYRLHRTGRMSMQRHSHILSACCSAPSSAESTRRDTYPTGRWTTSWCWVAASEKTDRCRRCFAAV